MQHTSAKLYVFALCMPGGAPGGAPIYLSWSRQKGGPPRGRRPGRPRQINLLTRVQAPGNKFTNPCCGLFDSPLSAQHNLQGRKNTTLPFQIIAILIIYSCYSALLNILRQQLASKHLPSSGRLRAPVLRTFICHLHGVCFLF